MIDKIHSFRIADQYEEDALRFSQSLISNPEKNRSHSFYLLKKGKSFIDKIWNAYRFVKKNTNDEIITNSIDMDFSKSSITDKWILHSLNIIIEKINLNIENSRLHEASNIVYRFFRREFCDWYLEFSKLDVQHPSTQKTLHFTLMRLIQTLHPFMPLITENILRGMLSLEKEFLIPAKYLQQPEFDSKLTFYREYTDIEILKKLAAETRRVKSINKVRLFPESLVYIKTDSIKESAIISRELRLFNFIVKSKQTEIVSDFSNLPKGYKGACLNWEILIPLATEEERITELERLKRELVKIDDTISEIENQLVDPEFIENALRTTLIMMKKKLRKAIDLKDKIKETIRNLQ